MKILQCILVGGISDYTINYCIVKYTGNRLKKGLIFELLDYEMAYSFSKFSGDEMVEAILRRYENREGYVRLSILRHLAFEVVGKWKELGRALGLKDWQLEMIDMDYTKSGEKSYQMLKTWVCAYPNQATHENLRKALEDITVGRGDLAEKYCTVANNGQENVNTPNGNRETNSG